MSREKDIQDTLRMCNAIALVKEANILNKMSNKLRILGDMGLNDEAQCVIEDLFKEKKRQDPVDKWDEEEVRVCLMVSRKK